MKPEKITMQNGRLVVPDFPIIPFIEGDGTGPDITRAAMVVWNAAGTVTSDTAKLTLERAE